MEETAGNSQSPPTVEQYFMEVPHLIRLITPEECARLALCFLRSGFAKEEEPPSEAYCPQRLAQLAVRAAVATADKPETLHALLCNPVDPFSPAAKAIQERLDALTAAEAA